MRHGASAETPGRPRPRLAGREVPAQVHGPGQRRAQVPDGREGRARDIVFGLRDAPRAVAGVLALTTATLRAVTLRRPADASAGR